MILSGLVLEFKLKRRKVIAEIVDAGDCRYFKKGTKFVLGGFTPAGLCDSAYIVLSRDARVLRYGGALPWAKEGKVLTRCPDPHGALWQLKLANDSDIEAATSAAGQRRYRYGKASSCDEVSACRGMERNCPFSLVGDSALSENIKQGVKNSAWLSTEAKRQNNDMKHYYRLKVALAACPNACTQPQVKDIGIIANVMPRQIGSSCNGCGCCEDVCQEEAIAVRDGMAELLPERCVGCGVCVRECPQEAIESDGVRYRILVGGTMGRHPRWGQELCVVDGSHVVQVVESFLDKIAQQAKPGERVADVVERIEVTRLRKEIFPDV